VITRQRFAELTRYGLTGTLCASLNVFIALFLTEYVGLHYLVSLTLCSALVIVIGFFLNRSWTFRKSGTGVLGEFFRYSLTTSVNVVIGLVICAFLVEEVHVPYAYAIATIAVVLAPMTYVVHRVWTFGLSWIQGK
jgi:putative flippase GtrA